MRRHQKGCTREKSNLPRFRHSGEGRNPVKSISYGFRVKPGMTTKGLFLRSSFYDQLAVFMLISRCCIFAGTAVGFTMDGLVNSAIIRQE